jgi:putative hemolysin
MQELFIILALILINGLLAGAEIAIVSLRAGRVQELASNGSRAGVALAKLRGNSERFLATVQVGITCVGALAAAFGGATLADRLIEPLQRVPWLVPYAEELALGIVVAAISYLSVVVGELVPKSLALRNAEPYALLAARPLLALASIAAPAVWLLTLSSNLILRPFRDQTNFTEARISLEEVRQMVNEASRSGSLEESVGEITSRVIDFAELTVKEVMVHRRFVVALPRTSSDDELRHALLDAGHRRIPIYDKSVDHVVGYVSWRDVIARVWKGEPPSIDTILRPAHFVPENRLAIDLMHEMREERIHLAIVIDEHGGLAGIVTLEDLLEELVGDIVSEHSTTARTADAPDEGPLVLPGTTPIRDVERELGLSFADYPEDYATIGGWCVALAGDRIPATGERFTAEGIEIEVLEASPRRVRSVAVRVLPRETSPSD